MVRIVYTIIFLFFGLVLNAQSSYEEAIQLGDSLLQKGEYEKAINMYFAAEAFDPSEKQSVALKVNQVFKEIMELKDTAEAALKKVEQAKKDISQLLIETQNAKNDTEVALNRAKKLTDAFYFYEDRFALAVKKDDIIGFYFIDKNGDKVEKLGKWIKAEQFDSKGFAKVETPGAMGNIYDYLLDTFGNTYRVAYDLNNLDDPNIQLTALDLSEKNLKEIPVEVCNYDQLKILRLGAHELENLPIQIGQLTNLTFLDLDLGGNCSSDYDNGLEVLPAEIGQLTNLTKLDLTSNNLHELPAEIGQLTKLIELNLHETRLHKLPAEIGQLTNLTKLDLGINGYSPFVDNGIAELPPEIGQLKSLTSLDLRGNQLTKLPAEIGQLTNLTSLNLSSNQLQTLPIEIGQLTNLMSLDLSGNLFIVIPQSLQDFLGEKSNLDKKELELLCNPEKRTELSLRDHHLSKFPVDIRQFTNLTSLDLTGNNLTELPTEIEKIDNLTTLYWCDNFLTELPPEIGRLTNLTMLDLSTINGARAMNSLTALPAELGQLTKLTSLDLYGNKLTELPPEIGKLKSLTSLDLEFNKLTKLPAELGQLGNLTSLDLSGNQLQTLPNELGQLTNLTSLNLSRNQLQTLPNELGQLTNLQYLNLKNNPLTEQEQEKIKALLPNCKIEFKKIYYYEIANNAYGQGKYQDALQALLKDIDQNNTPASYANAGLCYRILGDYEKAIEYQNKYLELIPNDPYALNELAIIYVTQKKFDKVWELAHLEKLDLSNLKLAEFPLEVLKLQKLKELNLRNNELKLLPAEIKQLKSLEVLILSGNHLTELPPEIVQLGNLVQIGLRGTPLLNLSEKTVEFLKGKTDLVEDELGLLLNPEKRKHLSLRGLNLTQLPSPINQMTNLTSLDLSNNQLNELPEFIGQLEKLRFLNLEGNPISEKEQKRIKELLPQCKVYFSEYDPRQVALIQFKKGNYKKSYKIQNRVLSEYENDVITWVGLSQYALFVNKPQKAIYAANKSMELKGMRMPSPIAYPPSYDSPVAYSPPPYPSGTIIIPFVNINPEKLLVLAYILNNQWAEAEKVFRKLQSENFFLDDQNRAYFLQDLSDLEKAGITHPDFKKLKELLNQTQN